MAARPIDIPLPPDGSKRLRIETGLFAANTTVKLDGVSLATLDSAEALRLGRTIVLPDGRSLTVREFGWPVGRRRFVSLDGALIQGGTHRPTLTIQLAWILFGSLAVVRQLPLLANMNATAPAFVAFVALSISMSALAVGLLARRRDEGAKLALCILPLQLLATVPLFGRHRFPFLLEPPIVDMLVFFLVAHARFAIETLRLSAAAPD